MYNDLMKWCQKYDAVQRGEQIFWNCMKSYEREEPEEFKEVFKYGSGKVKCEINNVSYKLELPEFTYPMVYVNYDIMYDNKKIGWFRQIYLDDGSEFDEYLVIL